MTRKLIKLHAAATYHPPGYVADVLSGSTVDEAAGTYDCSPEHWAAMVAKYRTSSTATPPVPVQPVPRDKWPIGAVLASMARTSDDKGVGDTIARLAAKMGAAWAAKEFEKISGVPCGCVDRRAHYNSKYPYD